jgi:hypothetical protein
MLVWAKCKVHDSIAAAAAAAAVTTMRQMRCVQQPSLPRLQRYPTNPLCISLRGPVPDHKQINVCQTSWPLDPSLTSTTRQPLPPSQHSPLSLKLPYPVF